MMMMSHVFGCSVYHSVYDVSAVISAKITPSITEHVEMRADLTYSMTCLSHIFSTSDQLVDNAHVALICFPIQYDTIR